MSNEAEKIMAICDNSFADALGKQLGRADGTAHVTVVDNGDTIDVLIEFDPPSYLPMREPLPSRVPDLCPDEQERCPYCKQVDCTPECIADDDNKLVYTGPHPRKYA